MCALPITRMSVVDPDQHVLSGLTCVVNVAYCKLLWSHIIEKNILPVFDPR